MPRPQHATPPSTHLNCFRLLCMILKALLTLLVSSSGSTFTRESCIQVSYHFCQSAAVSHRFLYGSNSRESLGTLSYYRKQKESHTHTPHTWLLLRNGYIKLIRFQGIGPSEKGTTSNYSGPLSHSSTSFFNLREEDNFSTEDKMANLNSKTPPKMNSEHTNSINSWSSDIF